MNINGNTNTDVCSESEVGDTEANETTSLLRNVSTETVISSLASSVFNLMNAIMGSGILGLAYAMASTGIVGFCILLSVVASLAAYSIHLLLKLCDQTGINSYEDLGAKALNKPGKVKNTHFLNPFSSFPSAMSSYLFILKSELPEAINGFLNSESTGNAWYEDGRLLLILITLCVVLPLSILPKIGKRAAREASTFAFWDTPAVLPFCLFSTLYAYAIPTMAFSFLCHTAVLPIYCELDRPSKSRMQNVTNVSISLSFLLYLISAVFGYLTFYAHVDSELLHGYGVYLPRDIMVITVRLAILLSVLLTVPLIHFPARKAAILLLFGRRPFSWLIHVLATLTILGVVLLMAIFVPDIRNVFGVVGSTTSSSLLFVFPGIFYLKISNQPIRSVDSIGAIFLVVFGLIMGFLSFSVIIITWIQST
uniref:Amino acid transporter transmembrane domain-containing protein n=1 Tax=Mola mola TaxID=94237 RepID=A0A3Q3WTZ2_MOLML